MKRITSGDLENWAPTRDCQGHLPLLVRKLIRASPVTIVKILIPAGDNVILSGYDGTLEVLDGTEYIPPGKSVWEMGSGRDYKEKAKKEFEKRTAGISEAKASELAFVFVTPYVWPDKAEWVNKQKEKGFWREVIVIDGLLLEEWIEQFPAVGAWLGGHLWNQSGNIISLEQFWQEWSKNLQLSISTMLVVSGRESEVKRLTDFVSGIQNILTIKASTVDESVAFIAATFDRMEDGIREEVFTKAVIVTAEADFRLLISSKNPMILLAKFEAGTLTDQGVRNGHHVIVPVSSAITAAKPDVELPRITRNGFEKGLQEMGFTYDEAHQLTRDSGQSLSVLRRLLKFEKNQQPEWAKDGHQFDIIPALLSGMWDEDKEEDKTIISLFAGEPYDRYISKLARWKVEKDAPILQIRSIWRITSALDAWSILAQFISTAHLNNFRPVFLTALSEPNSASKTGDDKSKFSEIYGNAFKVSHSLKEGLCQSLILTAVFGEGFKMTISEGHQFFADKLVHELLTGATAERWNALHDLLPFIAEASPASFLRAVEDSLSEDNPAIMKMFGSTYYTGLLWALESLLVAPEYILRSTMILGKLAKLDPGGNLANRPINSLRDAYIPWYNQSQADLSAKKNVMEKLAEKEPDVAWELFSIISSGHRTSISPINRCRWRFDSQHLDRTVTHEQMWDFQSFLVDKLIFLSNNDEAKISILVDFYPNVRFSTREKLLNHLTDSRTTMQHTKNLVWNELRELLAQHRESKNQEWALPEEDLIKIEKLYELYTPQDSKERVKYLFKQWPEFPEGISRSAMLHEELLKYADEKRDIAFREIYDQEGLQGILDFAISFENQHQLARTLARSGLKDKEEIQIFKYLGIDQSNALNRLCQGYIFSMDFAFGAEWVKKAWEKVQKIHSDAETLASFFLSLPQRKANWGILDQVPQKISEIYWVKMYAQLNHEDLADNLYVIEKLQEVGRHLTVVDKVSHIADKIPSIELVKVLESAATIKSSDEARLDSYSIGQIFETLHSRGDIDEQQLTRLEWMYLQFLADRYSGRSPKNLFRELTANAAFFVEVVSYVYMPDETANQKTYNEDEAEQKYQKADSARKLLEAWRDIPGLKTDGTIDKEKLKNWVAAARKKAKETNIVYGTDSEIGNLLACFPRNQTQWPPEEICEIIDSLNNSVVTSHFRTEIFNSRGVYTKPAYEGGNQERGLAAFFERMGKQILSKYPVTAGVLLELAKGYQRDAKEEDDSAQLDELR